MQFHKCASTIVILALASFSPAHGTSLAASHMLSAWSKVKLAGYMLNHCEPQRWISRTRQSGGPLHRSIPCRQIPRLFARNDASPPPADLQESPDAITLYKIEGDVCREFPIDKNNEAFANAIFTAARLSSVFIYNFEQQDSYAATFDGLKKGTCSSQGFSEPYGTETFSVLLLGKITVSFFKRSGDPYVWRKDIPNPAVQRLFGGSGSEKYRAPKTSPSPRARLVVQALPNLSSIFIEALIGGIVGSFLASHVLRFRLGGANSEPPRTYMDGMANS
eukprot:gnl/TRDRNA2_/TRDRNA2_129815_c0_seq1.p1 gnl/TRDRNA2_/TRDRNA2_129815_c0~~gnl/TRDRNA2_/TRDRNA2_129815_c0_seq1.p1  ORF type:complete len:277 (+),score=22.74 gnl/TRDRNA2_/TRDRNA2_129815_c0_seq1:64-894(+)